MSQNHWTVLAYVGALMLSFTPAHSYPENYVSGKLGASVSTQAKLWGDYKADAMLSDGPVSKGGFAFADVQQAQVFTIDLGQEREFDRIEFGSDNAGGPRSPKLLMIQVSNDGPDGPYETILERANLGWFQVLRLPLSKARSVRFDLGEGATGGSARAIRIYKGYEHPKLAEVTKLLYERIKPGLPGLEKFYAAAEAGDWPKACSELRAYFAEKHNPGPPPDPSGDPKVAEARDYAIKRSEEYASGKLNYAGIERQESLPLDWSYQKTTDWYEHKNFLNRGSRVGASAQAYNYTGDKKWADEFRNAFYDWVDANPKPTVMSGADYPTWRTLDSAARGGWFMNSFENASVGKDFDDELWANILFSVWEHADYLKNDNFTGGNWLAVVSGTVVNVADEFPEFKDEELWRAYGGASLETNVMRDVYPDGKESEDAPGYVCMAYGGMLGTLKAMDKLGRAVNPEVRERLNKTQDFLAAVTQPNGNMPAIGDWGGGPPGVLNDSAEYFKRDDIKYVLTKGKEGVVPAKASMNFPYGGWSVMRSAYDEKPYEDASHLVFKSSSGSHGHNDMLTITNYAYGRELLIDPGIRSYEARDVQLYISTPYHNTVCVDGKDTARGQGKTEKWVSNDGLDYVFGSNAGYPGVTHRRSVIFIKPDYWLVHDDVVGEGSHTYDQNWHFAEDAGLVEIPRSRAVHTSYTTGGNLLILPVDPGSLMSGPVDFFIAKERMGAYGEVLSKGWRYSKSGPAPQVFDVVLYPYKNTFDYSGAQVPKVSVKPLMIKGAAAKDVTALRIDNGDRTDYVFISRVGPRRMAAKNAKVWVNGEVVVIRTRKGKAVRVSGSNVTCAYYSGKNLFRQSQPAAELDQPLPKKGGKVEKDNVEKDKA